MKKLIIVLVTLSLSGCFYQSIHPVDIKSAENFCKNKGGVHSIDSFWHGEVRIYCKNLWDEKGINQGNKIDVNQTSTERYLKQEYIK